MISIESALQKLDEIYQNLEVQLQKPALAAGEYPRCIAGQPIEDASGLVTNLLVEFHQQDFRPDRSSHISALCARIVHMLKLAEDRAEELRTQQSAAREELKDLQVGSQFLHSMQGYRENQPRFVDAHH